jgi:PTH1 family peptidyl-tRNA hydrolase
MRLVVGLGNPGTSYRDTPHNAGFWVCDRLAERHGFGAESRKYQGLFRRGRLRGEDVGLLKPQTYMNLSGDSVAEALRYLPVDSARLLEDLVVVYDEMDIEAGRLRLRPSGGHGGHNGMRSVIERIGTDQFARVRVGVGRPAEGRDPTGHLLSKIPPAKRAAFLRSIERAADAVEAILTEGVDAAMNRFNGPPPPEEAEGEEQA